MKEKILGCSKLDAGRATLNTFQFAGKLKTKSRKSAWVCLIGASEAIREGKISEVPNPIEFQAGGAFNTFRNFSVQSSLPSFGKTT